MKLQSRTLVAAFLGGIGCLGVTIAIFAFALVILGGIGFLGIVISIALLSLVPLAASAKVRIGGSKKSAPEQPTEPAAAA